VVIKNQLFCFWCRWSACTLYTIHVISV